MCPELGLSVSNSSICARPSQTFRVTEVPSNSTQVFEPVKGFRRRFRWIFQLPSSKSKSCCPSGSATGCGESAFDVSALDCANTETGFETTSTPQHNKKKIRIDLDAFIAFCPRSSSLNQRFVRASTRARFAPLPRMMDHRVDGLNSAL